MDSPDERAWVQAYEVWRSVAVEPPAWLGADATTASAERPGLDRPAIQAATASAAPTTPG